jgi:hypothetical protein
VTGARWRIGNSLKATRHSEPEVAEEKESLYSGILRDTKVHFTSLDGDDGPESGALQQ